MYPKQYPEWEGRRALKSIFCAIAAALWLGALALPAYSDDTPGLAVFIMGWITLFDGHGFAFLAWFGNLPFIVAVFMFIFGRREKVILAALILSIVAALFSFGAFTVDEVPGYQSNSHVSPYIGCYTWVIANITFLIGVVIYYSRQQGALNANRQQNF